MCQNESNDLGAMTTFCQLRTTQVRRNIELHSTDTFFEIDKSSSKAYFFAYYRVF